TAVLDVTDATMLQRSDGRTHAYVEVLFDPASGRITRTTLFLEVRQGTSSTPASTFTTTAQDPALRPGDGYAAFSGIPGGVFADIHTIVPGQPTTEARAPDPINAAQTTFQYQLMPAWSPDAN